PRSAVPCQRSTRPQREPPPVRTNHPEQPPPPPQPQSPRPRAPPRSPIRYVVHIEPWSALWPRANGAATPPPSVRPLGRRLGQVHPRFPRIRAGLRAVCGEVENRVGRRTVGGPRRHAGAVWITGLGEVAPVDVGGARRGAVGRCQVLAI